MYIYIYRIHIDTSVQFSYFELVAGINSDINSDIINLLYNQIKCCFYFRRMAICILCYHDMRFGIFELS